MYGKGVVNLPMVVERQMKCPECGTIYVGCLERSHGCTSSDPISKYNSTIITKYADYWNDLGRFNTGRGKL